jgi:transcription elongation factor Elf1
MNDLCTKCQKNTRAINYIKNNKKYYRKICYTCLVKKRNEVLPQWQLDGYKKKFKCESCDFIAKHNSQLTVIDINSNYKTICLNCDIIVKLNKTINLKKGDLKSDF